MPLLRKLFRHYPQRSQHVQKTEKVKPTETTETTPTDKRSLHRPQLVRDYVATTHSRQHQNRLPRPVLAPILHPMWQISPFRTERWFPLEHNFTKTWSMRNAGSCTWTSDYSLVWTGGDMKGPSNTVPLTTTNILPGQTVHVSVTLTAPDNFIKYRSFWKLMNKSGKVFGIMDNTGEEQSIWAEIVVGNTYDFDANMCSATWTSSSRYPALSWNQR